MLSRRELIAGGAAIPMARGEAAGAQQRDRDLDAVTSELSSVRDVLVSMQSQTIVNTPTVNQIRDRQRQFLRLNQRFPQCIDIGIRVWERMQDWHIAHHRPLTVQRGGDGHWQMEFIMTVLVLKLELAENEVGQAYDR